ncbi:MAG: tRNA pseudouridine(55) synthase TruB [Patescibacteria group bacterium]|nr:tRNA pseudouridine(55) synthase TruB [Patescibacteria group bacterium]MDD5491011.1 tRNA pseudouridine(55) synthase TruB [Patescibacteria group bacterium]
MNIEFLLINKPKSWTSHDVIAKLRGMTGIQKIGHAGTLDPFATGLLIVGVGREATKEINKFVKLDKEYIATLRLGKISDTYDSEGKITDFNTRDGEQSDTIPPTVDDINKVLKKFLRPQPQIPPMFSAKKVHGKKLYELARQGKKIERQPQQITIYKIELLEYDYPCLKIKIQCSSGTYIRSLAYDIGLALNRGAYLEELQRTEIGKYKLKDAVDIGEITAENWQKYLKEL